MKVAVSCEGRQGLESVVSHHFGRCPFVALVEVEGTTIRSVDVLENPYAVQHQPGDVPRFVRAHGAQVMISGGMGRRALGFFEEQGVTPVTGAAGTVGGVVTDYLHGRLTQAEPCSHHEDDHGDHHHGHHGGQRGHGGGRGCRHDGA